MAKEIGGVPRTHQPSAVTREPIRDAPVYTQGRVYEFRRPDGSTLIIREHALGHSQYGHGSHFNVEVIGPGETRLPLLDGISNVHVFFGP
jgi:hypothetical protein